MGIWGSNAKRLLSPPLKRILPVKMADGTGYNVLDVRNKE